MRRESRRNCWLIISLIVYLLMIVEYVNVTQSNGKIIPFLTNLKTSIKCACKHPQPRLIHIDELEEYRIPNAIFLPAALLIHRCDRSVGYCHAPAHECASVVSQEEDVTFHVKNLFTPLKPRLTSLTLRNHTTCKCVTLLSSSPANRISTLNDIPHE